MDFKIETWQKIWWAGFIISFISTILGLIFEVTLGLVSLCALACCAATAEIINPPINPLDLFKRKG